MRLASPAAPIVAAASSSAFATPSRPMSAGAADERRSVVRDATASGELTPRSAHADFDVVRIADTENPEAVADALSRRAQVVYAQAAYRVHSTLVPNDPDYGRLQWKLPLINMEK